MTVSTYLFVKGIPLEVLQWHIDEGIVDDPPLALSSFLQIRKAKLVEPTLKLYQVEISLYSLTTTTQSGVNHPSPGPPATDHNAQKMMVWVPALILEHTLPALVRRFKGQDFAINTCLDPIFPLLPPPSRPMQEVHGVSSTVMDLTFDCKNHGDSPPGSSQKAQDIIDLTGVEDD